MQKILSPSKLGMNFSTRKILDCQVTVNNETINQFTVKYEKGNSYCYTMLYMVLRSKYRNTIICRGV